MLLNNPWKPHNSVNLIGPEIIKGSLLFIKPKTFLIIVIDELFNFDERGPLLFNCIKAKYVNWYLWSWVLFESEEMLDVVAIKYEQSK